MLKRELNIPKSNSFFLFGARQSGKTTLIRNSFKSEELAEINLLQTETYSQFVSKPDRLREEVWALSEKISHVLIDEAQRVPDLLNEVQYLIDKGVPQKFILTGSSARKLKRGRANLLGGRAWSFELFPLTFLEVPKPVTLNQILSTGTLPANILTDKDSAKENLRAYTQMYLQQEIEAEALSRNIGGFIRFLEVAAQCNGEQINFSNIARDVLLSSVTVKEYFKILEDTLLGRFLPALNHSERKKFKTSPKFYFFDTGVLRSLQKRLNTDIRPQTFEYGNYFETWVINEVVRISHYLRKDLSLSFLRTAADVEVDLIITTPSGEMIAVEIKSKDTPIELDYEAGFNAIRLINQKVKKICVCTAERSRKINDVEILPYQEFFKLIRSL
jgi:predicted AAA+ superfamily ATPase